MIRISSPLICYCFWPISTFVRLVQACPSFMKEQCTETGATERKKYLACVYWSFLVHFNVWKTGKKNLWVYRTQDFEIHGVVQYFFTQNLVGLKKNSQTLLELWYYANIYYIKHFKGPLGIGQLTNSIFVVEIYIYTTFHNRFVFCHP